MIRCSALLASLTLAATTAANAQVLVFGGATFGNFYFPTNSVNTVYNNCFVTLPSGAEDLVLSEVRITYLRPATAPALNVTVFATEMTWTGTGLGFGLGAQTDLGTFPIPAGTGAAEFVELIIPGGDLLMALELASNPGLGGFWIGMRGSNATTTGNSGVMTANPPGVGANYNFFGIYNNNTATFGLFQLGGAGAPFSRFYVDVYGKVGGKACDAPASEMDEAELCGEDLNGGCNADEFFPEGFTVPIPNNVTFSGTYWAEADFRDTDWYSFTVDETSSATVQIYSDGPGLAFVTSGGSCGELAVLAVAGGECGASATVPCLAPGTYRLIVLMSVFVGFPCESGSFNNYTVALTTTPNTCPICGEGGDCCVPSESPSCNDAFCCENVCFLDPFCCAVAWDEVCVQEAVQNCFLDCPTACDTSLNDCCVASSDGTPGCSDVTCCETVCSADPFCCDTEWDAICAQEAFDFCGTCGSVKNDECETATPIFDGDTAFSTLGATDSDLPLPGECEKGSGLSLVRDIWFTYEATCTGTATFSTCNQANYDTRLALYSDCLGSFVACNDDGPGCAGFSSLMEAEVVCGETYYLRVGGFDGAAPFGSGTMSISCTAFGPAKCPGECKSDGNADFNGNDCVDGDDLGTLLGLWGPDGGLSIADFNCDDIVDGDDLGTLLGQWGGTGCP
ncbi:MAG: hypothetical protein FJ253_03555 [Phycisphaerae bacterium]|nr:hypothetical protein [Phycisphaerae bacterium]